MPKIQNFEFAENNYFTLPKLSKRKNQVWIIEYYVENRHGNVVRKRQRVKNISPYQKRLELAKDKMREISERLKSGWNPDGINKMSNNTIINACDMYLKRLEDRYKADDLRYDSFRSYKSLLNLFKNYLIDKKRDDLLLCNFTQSLVLDYLHYIKIKKNKSYRYANNNRAFLKTFCNYLVDNEMMRINPVQKIKAYKRQPKQREIIPEDKLKVILNEIKAKNFEYYIICLLTYLCFIRRTELTKLKVKDFEFQNYIIRLRPEVSKNKNNDMVTIPEFLIEILKNHIKNKNENDFVFSADNFKPGCEKLHPKKISEKWAKIRTELNFKKTYQFYSLKDTGITRLFKMNIPTITIRDQARHSDIKTTETYTPKIKKADDDIRNLSVF